jgi:hypothetical protein
VSDLSSWLVYLQHAAPDIVHVQVGTIRESLGNAPSRMIRRYDVTMIMIVVVNESHNWLGESVCHRYCTKTLLAKANMLGVIQKLD